MSLILAGCPKGGDSDSDVDTSDVDTNDVDTSDGTDGTGGTGGEEIAVLNYDSPCTNTSATGPGTGEDGHWSAAALDVGAANIDQVRILFASSTVGANCTNGGEHTVRVWAGGSTPEASPGGQVYTGTAGGSPTTLELDVDIDVDAGERLYVALQHNGTFPDVSCALTCSDGTGGTSYWSNAASAPFSWERYNQIGISADFAVEAYGTRN